MKHKRMGMAHISPLAHPYFPVSPPSIRHRNLHTPSKYLKLRETNTLISSPTLTASSTMCDSPHDFAPRLSPPPRRSPDRLQPLCFNAEALTVLSARSGKSDGQTPSRTSTPRLRAPYRRPPSPAYPKRRYTTPTQSPCLRRRPSALRRSPVSPRTYKRSSKDVDNAIGSMMRGLRMAAAVTPRRTAHLSEFGQLMPSSSTPKLVSHWSSSDDEPTWLSKSADKLRSVPSIRSIRSVKSNRSLKSLRSVKSTTDLRGKSADARSIRSVKSIKSFRSRPPTPIDPSRCVSPNTSATSSASIRSIKSGRRAGESLELDMNMEIDYDTYDYEGNAVPEVPPLPSQGGKGRRMVSGFLKKLTPRKSRLGHSLLMPADEPFPGDRLERGLPRSGSSYSMSAVLLPGLPPPPVPSPSLRSVDCASSVPSSPLIPTPSPSIARITPSASRSASPISSIPRSSSTTNIMRSVISRQMSTATLRLRTPSSSESDATSSKSHKSHKSKTKGKPARLDPALPTPPLPSAYRRTSMPPPPLPLHSGRASPATPTPSIPRKQDSAEASPLTPAVPYDSQPVTPRTPLPRAESRLKQFDSAAKHTEGQAQTTSPKSGKAPTPGQQSTTPTTSPNRIRSAIPSRVRRNSITLKSMSMSVSLSLPLHWPKEKKDKHKAASSSSSPPSAFVRGMHSSPSTPHLPPSPGFGSPIAPDISSKLARRFSTTHSRPMSHAPKFSTVRISKSPDSTDKSYRDSISSESCDEAVFISFDTPRKARRATAMKVYSILSSPAKTESQARSPTECKTPSLTRSESEGSSTTATEPVPDSPAPPSPLSQRLTRKAVRAAVINAASDPLKPRRFVQLMPKHQLRKAQRGLTSVFDPVTEAAEGNITPKVVNLNDDLAFFLNDRDTHPILAPTEAEIGQPILPASPHHQPILPNTPSHLNRIRSDSLTNSIAEDPPRRWPAWPPVWDEYETGARESSRSNHSTSASVHTFGGASESESEVEPPSFDDVVDFSKPRRAIAIEQSEEESKSEYEYEYDGGRGFGEFGHAVQV